MAIQLRQDAQTESTRGNLRPPLRLMSASASEWRRQKWHQELEQEWQGRLSDLQQCICELLIKNQQLRESLRSTTSHR